MPEPPAEVCERAVAQGRMTSRREQAVRQRLGLAVGALGLAAHHAVLPSYALLAATTAAGYGVWETGRAGLWGCVLGGRWNIGGFARVPPAAFRPFVAEKRREFLGLLFHGRPQALALGVVLLEAWADSSDSAALGGLAVRTAGLLAALTALGYWISAWSAGG